MNVTLVLYINWREAVTSGSTLNSLIATLPLSLDYPLALGTNLLLTRAPSAATSRTRDMEGGLDQDHFVYGGVLLECARLDIKTQTLLYYGQDTRNSQEDATQVLEKYSNYYGFNYLKQVATNVQG